ncbi:hypothetical protein STCU_09861 [Strigomonas culicis]|uniref:Uncharacterized protein n=1 Tax=Strigomonas culicis TaxID=28005 RepID=S9TPP0_9TRYP|nr:hypothetical protein STCU_09861 [Strigomonas culicis]|eukprot:EPY18604.1 hypothetical protein STCU_09861 [Strigomonas culicis]
MKSAYGGLFQDPPYLSTNADPKLTDPYDKQDCIPSKYLGKNMTIGHAAPGPHPDGFFEKKYLTLASLDQNGGQPTGYRDDTAEKAKMKASQAKISERDFRYASYPQKSTGPGSYYGCVQGKPTEYMTEPPRDNPPSKRKKQDSLDKAKEPLPNIKTSWPKKGTYGTPGTLLSNPNYNDNWRDEYARLDNQTQRRKMREVPPTKQLGPAFHASCVSKKYLDEIQATGASAVYKHYDPPAQKERRKKNTETAVVQAKPFIGSAKCPGQQGCINPFPQCVGGPVHREGVEGEGEGDTRRSRTWRVEA